MTFFEAWGNMAYSFQPRDPSAIFAVFAELPPEANSANCAHIALRVASRETGLESLPDQPPQDVDIWAWCGAADLKDVALKYGLAVRRSVRGGFVIIYPVPVDSQLVEYADDCLRDCRGYLAGLDGIPVIPPGEALAEFRRMGGGIEEVAGGFVPVYPEDWLGYLKDAAQGLFLAAVDAIEEELK